MAQHPIERGAWLLIRISPTPGITPMDPETVPVPGTVLIKPLLNHRKSVAGAALESVCRDFYGDSELIPTWKGVVAAVNHIGKPHKLFATQMLQFPR